MEIKIKCLTGIALNDATTKTLAQAHIKQEAYQLGTALYMRGVSDRQQNGYE